jgi:acyl-CoA thioesterase
MSAAHPLYATDLVAQTFGMELLEFGPGAARVAMTVKPTMANGHGICHGGMVFALADTAFAYACNSTEEAMVASGASIDFLTPALVGERLVAVARETARSGRQGIYDVAVSNESGTVRAHFRGRCARLRLPSNTP